MNLKQIWLLIIIYVLLGLCAYNSKDIIDRSNAPKVCYSIVAGTEHSYLTTGKHPDWKVKMKIQDDRGYTAWRTVTQAEIDKGRVCDIIYQETWKEMFWLVGGMLFGFATLILVVIALVEGGSRIWNALE